MSRAFNPADVASPLGPYSHGVVSSAAGRWLHVAGQIGMRPDGSMAEGFEEQVIVAWTNLRSVLLAAGMTAEHLVKVTTFVTDSDHLPLLGPIRADFLGEFRPASTVIVVKALAKAEWEFEVEAVAFKID